MALSILSWDLPPAEQIETYNEKAHTEWIPTVLKQPGVKEFRAYRNPYHTTPQVVVHTEFDSLASWLKLSNRRTMPPSWPTSALWVVLTCQRKSGTLRP